jgi:transcriptional regulator with XRE-family HTH domain
MPTLAPQGEKLRSLRVARGWTQLELALISGVSERTVRNAERGQPIRRSFLDFVSTALGVEIDDVAAPSALAVAMYWQRNLDRLSTALRQLAAEQDGRAIVGLAHPEIRLNCQGTSRRFGHLARLFGDYHGVDGARRYVDRGLELFAACRHIDFGIEPPKGGGNVFLFRSREVYHLSNGETHVARSTNILEYSGERILRFDQFHDLPSGPEIEHRTAHAN